LISSIGWIDGDDASEVSKQALAKRILESLLTHGPENPLHPALTTFPCHSIDRITTDKDDEKVGYSIMTCFGKTHPVLYMTGQVNFSCSKS
jgi:hypothetical protein